MADAVEVAIEFALLNRVSAFIAANQSPDLALTLAYPNVQFQPPTPSPTARWLRANFYPLPSLSPHISASGVNKHYGFLQIDVFWGQMGGDIAPSRLAARLIEWFKRGTEIWHDGFKIKVLATPYRGPSIKDDSTDNGGPWWMVPVRIPYSCFASDPA